MCYPSIKIEKIIKAHVNMNYKAIIETFIVKGARCNKIRNLNIGDIKEEGIEWFIIRVS